MKRSKAFKEWQRDLEYLAVAYNISSKNANNEPADVFSQILRAAHSIPEEVEKMLGQKMLKSMEYFLKTTAGSLLRLQNLLKLSLNLNLISISDYHSLTKSMHEIGTIIKKFIRNFNSHFRDAEQNLNQEDAEIGFWALN